MGAYLSTHLSWTLDNKGRYTLHKSPQNEDSVYRLYYELSREYGQWYGQQDLTFPENNDANSEQALLMTTPFTVPLAFKSQLSLGLLTGSSTHAQQSLFHALVIQKSRTEELAADRDAYIHQGLHRTRLHKRGRLSKRSSVGGEALDPKVCMWACFPDAFWAHYRVAEESAHPTVLLSVARVPLKPDEATRLGAIRKTEAAPAYCVREAADATYQCTVWTLQHAVHHVALLLRLCCPEVSADESLHTPAATLQAEHAVRLGLTRAYLFLDKAECVCPRVPTQRLHTLVTTEVTAMVEALVNDRSSLGAVGVDAAISRAWQHTVLGRTTGGGLGIDSASPPPPLSPRGAVARKRLSSVRVSDVAAAVSAAAVPDPLRAVTSLPLTMLNETLFDPTAVCTPAAAAAASSQPRPSRPAAGGSRQRSLGPGGAAVAQTPPAERLSMPGTPLETSSGRNSSGARRQSPATPLRELPASTPCATLRPGNWDASGDASASSDEDDTPPPAAGTSPKLAPPAMPAPLSPVQASVELKPFVEASPQEAPLSPPPASPLQGGSSGGGGGDADGAAAEDGSGHEAEAEAEAADVAARMKPAARPRRERRKTPPSMMELAGDTRGIAPCEITAALVSQHQREALEDVNESERTQDLKRFRDGGGLSAILGGGEAWMTDDLRAEKQQQWREAVLPPTASDSANMQNASHLLLDSMAASGGGGGDAAPGAAEGSDGGGGGEGRGGTPANTSLQERRRRQRKERHSRDLREWETECRDGSDDEDFKKGTGSGAGWLGGPGTRDLALQLLGSTPAKLLAVKASGGTGSVSKSTATASAKIAIDRLSSVQRVVYALLWQQIDVVLMGAQALARRACGPSLTLAAAEEEVERVRAICAWLRTVPQQTPPPLVGVEREREMTPWEAADGDVLSVRVTLSDVAASVKATAEGWAALSCTNNMVPETLTTLPPYARALGEDGVRERGVQASCVYPTLVALLHDLSADFRAVDYTELHAAADAAASAAAAEQTEVPTTPFLPNGEAATAPDHLWAVKRGPASPAMSKASSYSSFCHPRAPEFAADVESPFPRPPGGGTPADAPAPRRWFRNASVVGGAAAAPLLSATPGQGPERTVTYARRGSRAVKPASQKDAFQDREKRRREVVAALRRHQQSPSQPPTAEDEDDDMDSPSEEGASSTGESPPLHDLSGGVSILQYGPERVAAQPVTAATAARRRTNASLKGGRGGARSSKRNTAAAEAAAAQPQAPQSPTASCVAEELSSEESDARETVSGVIRRDPAAIRNYNTCESDAQLRHAVVSDLLSSGALEVPPSGSMPSHMTWTHHGSASGFPFIPTPSRHPVGTAGESTIAPQWIQFLQPTTKQARTLFALRSMLDADLSTAANQAALFRGNGFHSLASIVGRRVDYRLRTCAACALLICAQNCAAVKYMYEDVVPKLVATLASQCHDEQPAVSGEQVVLAGQLSRLAAEVAAAPRLRRYEDARTAHARLLAVVSFVLASMALSLQRAKSLMWSLDVRATATALLTACLRDKEDLLRVSLLYLLRSVNYPAPRRASAAPRVRHMPGLAPALVAVLRSPDTAVRELQAVAAVICEYRASAALQAELAAAHAVRHINRALGELSQQLAASALTLGHGNDPCARDTRPQRDTGVPSVLPACLRDLASARGAGGGAAAPNGLRRRVDMPKGVFLSRCLSYILLLQAFDACMSVREGALQVTEGALREYAAQHLCLAQRLLKTRSDGPLHGPLVVFADLGDMGGVGGRGSGVAFHGGAEEWDPFAYPLILLATLTGLLASLAGHDCPARTALSRDAALVEAMCCLAIVASSSDQNHPVAAPKLQRVVTHVKAGAAAFLKGVAGCRAAAPLLGPHVPRFLAEVGSGDVAVVSASLCSVLEALVREGGVRGARTRRYVLRQAHLYTVWRAVQSFAPAVRAAAASCLASLVHPGDDHTAETGLPCDDMVEAFLSCLGDRLPILVQFLDPQNPVNDLVDCTRDYLAVQVALCELIANVTHFLNARSLLNTRGLLAVLLKLCKENKSSELLGAASHCLWLVAESMPKEVWEGGALQILADKLCTGNKRADKYIVLTVRVLVDTQSACYQTCIQTGIVSYLVQLLGSSDPVVQASVAASLSTIRRSQQVRATKQRSRSGFLRHLPAH